MVSVRAFVLVVLTLVLAACTSSAAPSTTTKTLPTVDLSATPKGWVPVAYENAQISVPASFYVLYPRTPSCDSGSVGVTFVGPTSGGPACQVTEQTTLASLDSMRRVPSKYAGEKPTILNGVQVLLGPHGKVPYFTYYVPSIGVELHTYGPVARQVAETLTRSPRAVALASGPAPVVPAAWRSLTFAGLQFSVPADWRTYRWVDIGVCGGTGPAMTGDTVFLTKATHPAVCHQPFRLPLAQQPGNGVEVDVDWSPLLVPTTFPTRCLALHDLTACPATSPAYSILVLKLTVPGRSKPVYVSIGLAGNGMIARTVLYSLRAA
jgi:hypothetical protein